MERITNHFRQGLVKLAPPFWGKPKIAALLQSFLNHTTSLEDAAWDVLEARTLDNADAVRLVVLGKIVGQPNFGWDLETYRAVIRGKIRTNRSRALSDDIIEVVRLITQTTLPVRIEHFAPATMWAILTEPAPTANELTALRFLLPKARGAGVKQHFFWAPSANPGEWADDVWGSITDPSAPAFQAVAVGVGTAGTASVPWPAHAAGDLGVLYVTTANQPVATPAGWTPYGSAGVGTAGLASSVRIQAFCRVAASAAEPNVSVVDVGDHQFCNIITYRSTGTPFTVEAFAAAASADATSTAAAAPSVTTLGPNRRIVTIWAAGDGTATVSGYSAPANTERYDAGAGAFNTMSVADGVQAAAGPTGAQSATLSVSSRSAAITLALAPSPVPASTYWSAEKL